jgi:hypothetical protein
MCPAVPIVVKRKKSSAEILLHLAVIISTSAGIIPLHAGIVSPLAEIVLLYAEIISPSAEIVPLRAGIGPSFADIVSPPAGIVSPSGVALFPGKNERGCLA